MRSPSQAANTKNPTIARKKAHGSPHQISVKISNSIPASPPTPAPQNQPPNKKDRCLQWAEKRKPLLEVIGIAILGIYTGLTYLSWRGVKESNSISVDVVRRSHRPWLFADQGVKTLSPIVFDASGNAASSISYFITNSGTSPGMSHISNWIVVRQLPLSLNEDYLKQFRCDWFDDAVLKKTNAAVVIAPGAKFDNPGTTVKSNTPFKGGGPIDITLCIKIAYRDEFNSLHCSSQLWSYVDSDGHPFFYSKGPLYGHWARTGISPATN